MGPSSESSHPVTIAQLCDYYLGQDSPEDRKTVEAHLATCIACREIFAVMALLSGVPVEVVAPVGRDHPLLEELVAFYRKPEAMPHTTREGILSHLEQCPDCRSELEFLRELEGDLRQAGQPHAT